MNNMLHLICLDNNEHFQLLGITVDDLKLSNHEK